LFDVLDLTFSKQLVQSLKVLLNPLSRFLLDGIHFHPDVIGVDIPILLDHQRA
jgi:hypothetical protein